MRRTKTQAPKSYPKTFDPAISINPNLTITTAASALGARKIGGFNAARSSSLSGMNQGSRNFWSPSTARRGTRS